MKEININNFKEKIIYEKLDNGLEVYLLSMSNVRTNYAIYGTKFGGVCTKFKVDNKTYNVPNGVAHFLEHKLFESKDGDDPFKFYAKTGAFCNAATSYYSTNYYFTGNSYLDENLNYLLDYVSSLYLTDENIEKEKGIIIEEAKMYEDNPDWVLYDKLRYNTYVNHPMKYKLVGEEKDIFNITKKELEICHKAFYQPNNMFLIVVGSFDTKHLLKLIKKNQEGKQNNNIKVEKEKIVESDNVFKKYEKIVMPIQNTKFACNIKLNKKLFTNYDNYFISYYLYMLLSLLFGSSSLFKEKLIKSGAVTYLDYSLSNTDDHFIINFMGEGSAPKEIIKKIQNHISNAALKQVDFERIKKVWIASEITMMEDVSSIVDNISSDIIDYNEFKSNKITDIKKLDLDTLKLFKDKISFENMALVVVTNK